MDNSFIVKSPKDIKENPIKVFGDDWTVIAAGTPAQISLNWQFHRED